MKDFVKKIELENYLSDESQDELSLKLDKLIALGSYNYIQKNPSEPY